MCCVGRVTAEGVGGTRGSEEGKTGGRAELGPRVGFADVSHCGRLDARAVAGEGAGVSPSSPPSLVSSYSSDSASSKADDQHAIAVENCAP